MLLELTDDKSALQGVQFMRTGDGGRKLIGGAEMVPLNPFQ